QEPQGGERAGGFVAVDAGRNVNAKVSGFEFRVSSLPPASESEQFQIVRLEENLGIPAVLAGGEFDVAQDLLDVDGIPEIPANIFAEALHGKIFIQKTKSSKFQVPKPQTKRKLLKGTERVDPNPETIPKSENRRHLGIRFWPAPRNWLEEA